MCETPPFCPKMEYQTSGCVLYVGMSFHCSNITPEQELILGASYRDATYTRVDTIRGTKPEVEPGASKKFPPFHTHTHTHTLTHTCATCAKLFGFVCVCVCVCVCVRVFQCFEVEVSLERVALVTRSLIPKQH